MYLVISWDISAVNPRWSQINDQMVACLKGYQQVRPVNTFYMLKVTGAAQRTAIMTCLKGVIDRTSEQVIYIISPLLTTHGWEGWLPQDRWPLIEQITSQ